MTAKKFFALACVLMALLSLVFCFSACGELPQAELNTTDAASTVAAATDATGTDPSEHTHVFSQWNITTPPSCSTQGMQMRTCTSCGFLEYLPIDAYGHTEVVDAAVLPTCIAEGKTEGKHCSTCNAVLVAATAIPSTGHQYGRAKIVKKADCTHSGEREYTCTVDGCNHSYTESYSLPTYSATTLYEQSKKYVGEVVVYDKSGAELGLASAVVISEDGNIITNYHVIEGAYSATVTLEEKTYPVESVLAFDANIDLAVLKINASGLHTAKICKKAVKTGETVYAMGSSRGLTNTYSQGIVTHADRELDGVTYVQHDASITHGNSGGALINVYGEVVGINTWGVSDSQNLNFAVFVGELDKLTYGTPMTLAEMYALTSSPYEILLNWVLENYNNTTDSYIEYCYSLDGDNYGSYALTYFKQSGMLALNYYYVFDSGDSRYVSIELSEDMSSYYYYASYSDGDYSYKENVMQGYIYPATFTRYSTIGYYSNEGDYWTVDSLLSTYQEGMVFALEWFDWFLDSENPGLTLDDFGFASFS